MELVDFLQAHFRKPKQTSNGGVPFGRRKRRIARIARASRSRQRQEKRLRKNEKFFRQL